MADARRGLADAAAHRFDTPTGGPCPRSVRVDGSVEGSGACVGCGTCLLFGGLVDALLPAEAVPRH